MGTLSGLFAWRAIGAALAFRPVLTVVLGCAIVGGVVCGNATHAWSDEGIQFVDAADGAGAGSVGGRNGGEQRPGANGAPSKNGKDAPDTGANGGGDSGAAREGPGCPFRNQGPLELIV